MAVPLATKAFEELKKAKELHHRLLMIVARIGPEKPAVLRDLAEHMGTRFLILNVEVSQRLLEQIGYPPLIAFEEQYHRNQQPAAFAAALS